MRDSFMHDDITPASHRWLRAIGLGLALLTASIVLLAVFTADIGASTCGGG